MFLVWTWTVKIFFLLDRRQVSAEPVNLKIALQATIEKVSLNEHRRKSVVDKCVSGQC